MRRLAQRTRDPRTHRYQRWIPRSLQPQDPSPCSAPARSQGRTSRPQGTPPSAPRVPQALWMVAWGSCPDLPQCCPWTVTRTHSPATIRPGSHVYSVVPQVPPKAVFPGNR
uniref:Testis cDNA clone: QtsA-13032, similar to human cyclin F (CCNF) n=1 Tax=Macaca fascicularis TaxID=9541 RepID=Q4R404_MACFA|nr:unnamed protein product [Macaca fascicularis]